MVIIDTIPTQHPAKIRYRIQVGYDLDTLMSVEVSGDKGMLLAVQHYYLMGKPNHYAKPRIGCPLCSQRQGRK